MNAFVMEEKPTFYQKVYALVRQIPEGRVTSYGAIARYLGSAGAARMVGWAMNNSHTQAPPVPAHRVVNRIGLLSGKLHFGDAKTMQNLLEQEGLQIKNDQIVDFALYFWDPMQELGPPID